MRDQTSSSSPDPSAPRPAAYGIADAGTYTGGLSKQTLYRLAASGQIRMVKIGRRTVIPTADLDALIAGNAVAS